MMKWACVIGLAGGLAACNGAEAPGNTTATDNPAATTGEATNAPISAATKKQDAEKIAIGAGAGAALGAILGGGSGAAKGAAVGGAGGTGVVLATKGKEVHLGPGAGITTRLTAPVTVRIRS